MAIDLLNSFLNKGNQITSGREPSSGKVLEQPVSLQAQKVLRGIRMLQTGQTLQGEILSVKGDQVQLEVLKEVMIEAKLAGALNLTPGTNMIFQVKGNQNGTLSLLPLFTNVSADPNILKALDMAGISVNDRTTEMVQVMMEKGMSVNKQSLLDMYRDILGNKEADVSDIVSLKQMGIEVTEDTLRQYTAYKEGNHFLSGGFEEIGKELGNQLQQWITEGKTEQAVQFLKNLEGILGGVQEDAGSLSNITGNGTEAAVTAGRQVFSELELLPEEGQLPSKTEETLINEELNSEGKGLEALKEEGASVSKAVLSRPETLEELWTSLSEHQAPKKFSKLFSEIWNRRIENEWMIKPEDVFQKKSVEQLYQKMEEQVKQLEQMLEDNLGTNQTAVKTVHQTASNLEFMNQLNQMHAYIQLPLKMTNQNTTGELYVFTNKKAVSEKEGKITALLHLDMEYLGKMDIHVSLENKKVGTNFYLEKEEILDFLEAHMDLLSSRLQKRGYECNIHTKLRKEEESETLIRQMEKKGSGQTLLSTQAFDMRA